MTNQFPKNLPGAGVESMSMGWGSGVMPEKMSEKVLSCQEAADCLIPMGMTSENVAEQYNISRDVQDTFAANSYAKALRAQKDGKFRSEIVPVKVGSTSGRARMMSLRYYGLQC